MSMCPEQIILVLKEVKYWVKKKKKIWMELKQNLVPLRFMFLYMYVLVWAL